jgi:competence protein ComEC
MNRFRILIIVLILILTVRFIIFYNQVNSYQDGQVIRFDTILFSEPQFLANYQKFTASLPTGESIFITASAYPQYKYADRLVISGPIRILPRAGGFQPRALEGQSYGASNQIVELLMSKRNYSLYFPKIEAVDEGKGSILAITSFIRQSVTELFNKILPPDLSSLLLGIVFGIKGPMSKEFVNNLRLSGVMHVIAASGMNITMVAGFLSSIFMLFLKRQTALFASILGIVFYAFLAGMQPSIIRASIMGILVFSSQILGKQSLGAYGLFLAGFIMLFVSPLLISDVGFQLSFTATAGLLYIRPLLNRLEKLNGLSKKSPLTEDLFITVSAQIATLPILLATFGTYSLWSILVNTLVLWTIPTLMILGGVGAIFGMILQPIGAILVYLCLPFLLYFQKIVMFFGVLSGVLIVQDLPMSFIVGYYLLLSALIIYFSKSKNA